MLINRKLPEATASEASHMQLGVWRCKPPKKILRFGALRAVLRHYSRIINKTFYTEFFHFFSNKNIPSYFLDVILCNSHNKYNVSNIFEVMVNVLTLWKFLMT